MTRFPSASARTPPTVRPRSPSWLLLSAGLVAVPLLGLGEARSQMICNAPLEPICMQSGTASSADTETSQKRCVSDIESYIEKLDEYIGCVDEQLEETARRKEDAQARMEEIKAEIAQ